MHIDVVYGDLVVAGSTFTGNRADADGDFDGDGASISNYSLYGRLWLRNSTIDEDESALYLEGFDDGGGELLVEHATIVADAMGYMEFTDVTITNSAVDGAIGPLNSLTAGGNAFTAAPVIGSDLGGNLLSQPGLGLGPLGDHGGETATMLPEPGSVLINQGQNGLVTTSVDQRGHARVVGGTVDIGAVELQGLAEWGHTGSSTVSPGPKVADGVDAYLITVTVTDADSNPVGGVEVRFDSPDADLMTVPTSCTTAGDGSCSRSFVTTVAGTYEVTITLEGLDPVEEPAVLEFVAGPVSLAGSTIEASPVSIPADGSTSSTVTVRLVDGFGNPVADTPGPVVITSDLGAIGATTDHGDGSFTATLTSAIPGTALLRFTVDGDLADASATVTVTPVGDGDGGGGTGGMAPTGADIAGPLAAVLALLAAGGSLLAAQRRRDHRRVLRSRRPI